MSTGPQATAVARHHVSTSNSSHSYIRFYYAAGTTTVSRPGALLDSDSESMKSTCQLKVERSERHGLDFKIAPGNLNFK